MSNVTFLSSVALAATIVAARPAVAQQAEAAERQPVAESGIDRTPSLHGTVRAKWEYQPDDDLNRFEVRNARLSVDGRLTPVISYKAEIDLADEGVIKMLDAYTRLAIAPGASLTVGQMRVPFTIDAHRSPHQQYFANRSFIAKQVGNVRDVGLTAACRIGSLPFPVVVEAGLYNGRASLTDQKSQWHTGVSYSAKAQFLFAPSLTFVAGTQTIKPNEVRIHLHDAGLAFDRNGLHLEAEYLFKRYADRLFADVNAVNAFAAYRHPVHGVFSAVSWLARYDYMDDHFDGQAAIAAIAVTDYRRHRATCGLTLSLLKPFTSDIRINYERYFYRTGAVPKIGEQDKFVIELMARF